MRIGGVAKRRMRKCDSDGRTKNWMGDRMDGCLFPLEHPSHSDSRDSHHRRCEPPLTQTTTTNLSGTTMHDRDGPLIAHLSHI